MTQSNSTGLGSTLATKTNKQTKTNENQEVRVIGKEDGAAGEGGEHRSRRIKGRNWEGGREGKERRGRRGKYLLNA